MWRILNSHNITDKAEWNASHLTLHWLISRFKLLWILGAACSPVGARCRVRRITGKDSSGRILIGGEVGTFCYICSHPSRSSGSCRNREPGPSVDSKVCQRRKQPIQIQSKMREIVHLQAGQCGNQIGAKVSPPKILQTSSNGCLWFGITATCDESPFRK